MQSLRRSIADNCLAVSIISVVRKIFEKQVNKLFFDHHEKFRGTIWFTGRFQVFLFNCRSLLFCFRIFDKFTRVFNTLHKKMTFSIKDFFSKCDQIRRKLRIWSQLLKKSLMENFIFCAVTSDVNLPRALDIPKVLGRIWLINYFSQTQVLWRLWSGFSLHFSFLGNRWFWLVPDEKPLQVFC